MFLLNLGGRWTRASDVEGIDSIVLLPSYSTSERLRRNADLEFQRVLVDPQLYLAGLEVDERSIVCGRLSTYSWFGVPGVPEPEGAKKLKDWKEAVRENVVDAWEAKDLSDPELLAEECLEFQMDMGCSHILLPSPLAVDLDDEGNEQAEWLDAGLGAAETLEVARPVLTTVAVHEQVLTEGAFAENGYLDALAEQVLARDGLEGVYIVVVLSQVPKHPTRLASAPLRAYAHLSRTFREAGLPTVLVNFADLFGLVSMSVGASGFASGASHSLRTISLAGFRDKSFGRAVPHLYSHACMTEFSSETDLATVVSSRSLRRIWDASPYSVPLLAKLRAGGSAAELPGWAESQNNLGMAQRHLLYRMNEEAHIMAALDAASRTERCRDWLDQAEALVLQIDKRFAEHDHPPLLRRPRVDRWLSILDDVGG